MCIVNTTELLYKYIRKRRILLVDYCFRNYYIVKCFFSYLNVFVTRMACAYWCQAPLVWQIKETIPSILRPSYKKISRNE